MEGTVIAICISQRRGTAKQEVVSAQVVEGFGIQHDAHGGDWHRQISLLSFEKVEQFNALGGGVGSGDFGENIVVSGIDLRTVPVGTRLHVGEALLEVTQIGKECHQHCEIFHRVGDCIMPREGIFAKVIRGGLITKGDPVRSA